MHSSATRPIPPPKGQGGERSEPGGGGGKRHKRSSTPTLPHPAAVAALRRPPFPCVGGIGAHDARVQRLIDHRQHAVEILVDVVVQKRNTRNPWLMKC